MTASAPLRPTRRGALAGAMLLLATSGCDAIAPEQPEPSGPRSPSPDAGSTAPADPDEALVARIRSELVDASVLVTSALRARSGLAGELAAFGRLHARHLEALETDRPRGRTPVRGNADKVSGRVREQEAKLQASLAAAAVTAQSGPLAALLASMSAAIAQQLAVPVVPR